MAYSGGLGAQAFDASGITEMDDAGRQRVRSNEDFNELLAFKVQLREIAAGRGLWMMWSWLLAAGIFSVTLTVQDAGGGLAVLAILVIVLGLILIVGYASRTRKAAHRADGWLAEVDFRLVQLASKG
jgi:hypothetical protein